MEAAMKPTVANDALKVAALDALATNICVLDPDGAIVAVNQAWKHFASTNSGDRDGDYIGINYLNVCRNSVGPASDEAPAFLQGLHTVLNGEQEQFQMEYPCHSPTELRWFLGCANRLHRVSSLTGNENIGAVVSHLNITDRKLVEIEYARLAATDPLTGIPNRRFFEDIAKIELERFLRFGEPSSLLMVDLDKFKGINDTYGHAAGDEVLRSVASLARTAFRSCDLFARLGGEEFVCLLPGTDEPGAMEAAEKLRQAIERLQIKSGSAPISVTASIGVTVLIETDATIECAILRADEALYRAKNGGRNCIKVSFRSHPQ
jgi:diguanylate cyclase (GGDEF)-like protein